MQRLGEQMLAEPAHLSPRARLLTGGALTVLLVLCMLTGETRAPGCRPPRSTASSTRPWLTADEPSVRDLHFASVDRPRTHHDNPPVGLLPGDVRRTAHRLGDREGVAVYLAGGSGFACLGVDATSAGYEADSVCLLNTSIANQGLTIRLTSGAEDSVLVVAVPDGADLLTASSTQRLADYGSVVVLRPRKDRVLLRQVNEPAILVNHDDTPTDLPASPCRP